MLMKKISAITVSAALVILVAFQFRPASGGKLSTPQPLPEFNGQTEDWLNSKPLNVADLQGKVVLLDFWTFGCWNCYRSFPWLNDLEQRLHPKGLQVIGIHTPEFEHEKNRENIIKKINEFKLPHPVMMDNDFRYWKAMNNRYWPTFYLVDKQGNIRASFIGETHKGDTNAQQIEQMITQLLKE